MYYFFLRYSYSFFGLYGLLQIEDWPRFGGDAPGFQVFLHVIPLQTQGIVFAV